jgi:DNA-binding MarR family transcriptional regulator
LAQDKSVQSKLENKLELSGHQVNLSIKEKMIYSYIANYPGCSSGDMVAGLNITKPTVKRILSDLIYKALIMRHGHGAGITYTISER